MLIVERYASRETTTGRNPSATLMYMVGQTIDEREVRLAVLAESPLFYEIPALSRLSTKQKPLGGGWWTAQVDYGVNTRDATKGSPTDQNQNNKPGAGDPLTPDIKVDFQSVQQHITQSLYVAHSYRATADTDEIQDNKGAIGVSKTGVAGCDIPVPLLTWTETWTFLAQFVTWGDVRTIGDLVGRTNNQAFRVFPPGEVMFMGGGITEQGVDKFRISFNFKRQPNVVLAAGKFLPGWPSITKDAWDYMDVSYKQSTGASSLPFVPRNVYIHRVGRPGLDDGANPTNQDDFSKLRIGS